MRIVIGRGNRRTVYELPCANLVKRADAQQVQAGVDAICDLLGLGPK